MFHPDENGVYAVVGASPIRRAFAYVIVVSLGAVVLLTVLSEPPGLFWMIFMFMFGIGALWLAELLRRATTMVIELTETELRDSNGTVLAHMDDIKAVERGVFAFKPSNGFILVLETKQPRSWAPGLWWRLGRRVGVGGVTSAGQCKFMAEQIAFRVAQRRAA
ncbi:hypothetical protein [Yoonia sp. BS5-3]|uniref:Integral membrane protein n=1 Tax=Yoonia phaeophyticola TaxID=3137369 RepID=A0ABZ2V5A0_9RHOB